MEIIFGDAPDEVWPHKVEGEISWSFLTMPWLLV